MTSFVSGPTIGVTEPMYGDGVPAASNGAASDSPMTGSGYTDQLATTRPHMWAGPGVPGPASSGDIERLRDDLNRFIERVMPLVETIHSRWPQIPRTRCMVMQGFCLVTRKVGMTSSQEGKSP